MDLRSSSSSPDPLGHPVDPEFLLSSATKPLLRPPSSRRNSVSPRKTGTPRKGRPPGTGRGTPSPRKTVKKQYGDMFLPSTPSGNKGGNMVIPFDGRSLSPTKTTLQSDGNISPWRIRVTVEAEREEGDDGEMDGLSQYGIGKPKTLKVPLKGTSSTESSPKRRRRGKSDIANRPGTPKRRRKTLGEKAADSVEQKKRKRSPVRRKSLQTLNEDVAVEAAPEDNPAQPREITPPTYEGNDPFLDVAMDGHLSGDYEDVTAAQSVIAEDDIQLVTDALQNNEISYPNVPTISPREVPLDRRKSPTPNIISPSPLMRNKFAAANITSAGHTPRPKRTYPTPSSPSVLGEDEFKKAASPPLPTSPKRTSPIEPENMPVLKDPTEEHREFDSIMESEGFSMVSLDSLPSARQRLQHILLNRNEEQRQQRVNSTRRPTPAAAIHSRSQLNNEVTFVSPPSLGNPPAPRSNKPTPQQKTTPFSRILSPKQQPPALVPTTLPARRRPLARLARVIRAGIALQGLVGRRRKNAALRTPLTSPNNRPDADSLESTRERFDNLFQDLNPEARRELRAGLRFGEQLAKNLYEQEQLQQHQMRSMQQMQSSNSRASHRAEIPDSSPRRVQSPNLGEPPEVAEADNYDALLLRREAEWQREREAVSRRIELANASQVIVLDSDRGLPRSPFIQNNYNDTNDDDRNRVAVDDNNDNDSIDDEGEYEDTDNEKIDDGADGLGEETDIWQQAAHERYSQHQSPSFTDIIHEDFLQSPQTKNATHTRSKAVLAADNTDEPTPSHPTLSARRDGFPILSVGKSKMSQYRGTNASLSSLLGTPDTVTRKFYEVKFGANKEPSPLIRSRGLEPSPLPHGSDQEVNNEPAPEAGESKVANSTIFTDQESENGGDGLGQVQGVYTSTPDERQSEQSILQSIENAESMEEADDAEDVEAMEDLEELEAEDEDDAVEAEEMEDKFSSAGTSSPSAFEPLEQTNTATWFNWLKGSLAPAWTTSTPAVTAKRSVPAAPTIANAAETPCITTNMTSMRKSGKRIRDKSARPPPPALALSGYFSDEHYVALRQMYWDAKEQPERFTYHTTRERESLLGKWMWSADDQHHRQVTEIQLAIVEQFCQKLVRRDIHAGGDGKMGWTEEEVLWRLFSIIVGEQIRRERRERLRQREEGLM